MGCKVKIRREKKINNRLRLISIFLNGEEISKIRANQEVELDLKGNFNNHIYAKVDWVKSNTFTISEEDLSNDITLVISDYKVKYKKVRFFIWFISFISSFFFPVFNDNTILITIYYILGTIVVIDLINILLNISPLRKGKYIEIKQVK